MRKIFLSLVIIGLFTPRLVNGWTLELTEAEKRAKEITSLQEADYEKLLTLKENFENNKYKSRIEEINSTAALAKKQNRLITYKGNEINPDEYVVQSTNEENQRHQEQIQKIKIDVEQKKQKDASRLAELQALASRNGEDTQQLLAQIDKKRAQKVEEERAKNLPKETENNSPGVPVAGENDEESLVKAESATVSRGQSCGADNKGTCMMSAGLFSCPGEATRVKPGENICETGFVCCQTTEENKKSVAEAEQKILNQYAKNTEPQENADGDPGESTVKAGNNTPSTEKTTATQDGKTSTKTTGTTGIETNKLSLSPENYDPIIRNNRILKIVETKENSMDTIRSIFSGKIISITNIIIGAVALIWLFILGIKFIFSHGQDENLGKYKQQFGWIVAGLVMVSVAEFAGFLAFDPTQNLVENETMTNNFYTKIMQVKLFIQYFIGGLVLINATRSGYNLITVPDGGEDESIQKEKTFVSSFLFGTALILLSEILVTGVLFVNGDSASASQGVLELTGLVNFIISFSAGVAAFMMVLSSLYYVISLGDEDRTNRAKKIIISCIMALVILFSVYTITRFLL